MPKRYKNMGGRGRLVRSTSDCIPEREAGSKCITHTTALAHELWDGCPLPQYDKLRDRPIKNTGYVADTYASAWHSVLNTDSFEDAISDAINRGGDADTVGSVTGMLTGRTYGMGAMSRIREVVSAKELINVGRLISSRCC